MLAWPWERTADVLHAWREWVSGLPNEMGTWARILQVPPLPETLGVGMVMDPDMAPAINGQLDLISKALAP
jgi:hypothetical protein